ncbi:MAG: hypothetical protein WC516_09715 [Patescibacteria group bacterium]|jgi:hypothetical protein
MKKEVDDFKFLVLGKAGKGNLNPFNKSKKVRKKKGNWDTMYGGQPDLNTKKKKRNFWVDTDIWFNQDY